MKATPGGNNKFSLNVAIFSLRSVVKHTECMYIELKLGRGALFKL
ncbi:hypothetical protein FHX12_002610 [Rhizobium sp. BK609]|nr:hypothetical protein [Rhizobium sp. BK098]MBB3615629.1 hypothetical protein [Rhizobium sp. BK609]MBB3681289.1 hypothetical protein [Rhizobium sp. BK612]